jgi:MSHA pilin protein MshD
MSIRKRRGFTLVEMILLIVVLSVAVVGVLLVFQNAVRSSADPQVYKQALAIGEALLDEILLASYDPQPGTGARANFDDVMDYNGYNTAPPGGIVDINGTAVPGLASYNAAVAVVVTSVDSGAAPCLPAPPGCAVSEAMRVTVTVTGPSGFTVSLDGYRMRYVLP